MYVKNVSEQECDNILVRDSTGWSEFIGQKPPEMWFIFSIFSRITVLPSKEIEGKKRIPGTLDRTISYLASKTPLYVVTQMVKNLPAVQETEV